jgi:hypothetical protein
MKVLSRVLVAAGIGAAAVLAVPAGAQAAPANCSVTLQHKTARALCTAGSGQYRAAISCIVLKPGDPVETTNYGGWVYIGLTSTASCGGGSQVTDYWWEPKN